ncbi:Rcs stress response system protein RcsF [Thalassotalea crassostreae]|uniref:Rcs stress response system protein RcsF n=1 Tax=Thalassotalea crassostreae TaxID=1763536 RepID=UPI0009EDB682|nr:Rcs stress response system protein RcsF [Thalassotalea crassostreae]
MTIKNILKIIPLAILSVSCGMSVDTNLDKENFDEYFATGGVVMYQSEDEFPGKSDFLGLVEGDSCKLKSNDKPANEIDARTMARNRAADMGANGVIFTSCTLIEDQQCLEAMVCYGKAYAIDEPKS